MPTSLILKFSYFDFIANSAPKKGPLVLILILLINFLLTNLYPEEMSLKFILNIDLKIRL